MQKVKSRSKNHFQLPHTALGLLCKNGCFTNLGLWPYFITMLFLQSTALRDVSLSLPGRPSDVNVWQLTLPTAQITKRHNRSTKNYCCTSNQASQMPVVGTAERLKKTELWGINSPIFLQKIFEWQGNVPMRLQMGNKPEKHQHLEILAVLV